MRDLEFEFEAELEDLMAGLTSSNLEAEAERFAPGASKQAQGVRANQIIWAQIGQGVRDENQLTNAVFFDRHPERKGKPLRSNEWALRREWVQIRDWYVRPAVFAVTGPAIPKQPSVSTPPAPSTPPAVSPAARSRHEPAGYSTFQNIQRCQVWKYPYAIGAQTRYRKVMNFFPYFVKINKAADNVFVDLDEHGAGNLLFKMTGGAFRELVESHELQNKIIEMSAGAPWSARIGGEAPIEFSEAAIEFLGLGLALLDLYTGLQREQRFYHDPQWRREQQFKFVFALMAEDLVKRGVGDTIFINRNSRDLAVEIENRYNEFHTLFNDYADYRSLDEELARWDCNIPAQPSPPYITNP